MILFWLLIFWTFGGLVGVLLNVDGAPAMFISALCCWALFAFFAKSNYPKDELDDK